MSEAKKRGVGRDEAKRFAQEKEMEFFEVQLGTAHGNMQIEKYILEQVEKLVQYNSNPVNLMSRNVVVKPVELSKRSEPTPS